MSIRAKLIGSVVLAAIALATWRFLSGSDEVSLVNTPQPVAKSAAINRPQATIPETVAGSVSPLQKESLQSSSAAALPAERRDGSNTLTERTLVGTKWAREGFGLEFAVAGKLLIGGRERAQWSVEGQRVRLYRETTGEEHWLDIVGDKLLWNGQEIGRVP